VKTDATGASGCNEQAYSPAILNAATIVNFPISGLNSGSDSTLLIITFLDTFLMDTTICYSCDLPIAQFSVDSNGWSYQFTSLSTAAASWAWDFGDGNNSTMEHPEHTYFPGNFTVCLTVANSCGTDSICKVVNVIWGIPEIEHYLVSIYPNPSHGFFQIEAGLINGGFNFKVVDILGNIVLQQEGSQFNATHFSINLNEQGAGAYFIWIETEDTIYRGKLILLPAGD